MENKIVVLEQLPIIKERLAELETSIIARVEPFKNIIATEETKTEVKSLRAELNKEKEQLESERKAIKKAILKPYEDFEVVFKKVVGHYTETIANLDIQIREITNVQIKEKSKELSLYFDEYKKSIGLVYDFLTLENSKVKINASDTLSKLKKQVKDFLDKVNSDISSFEEFEEKDEILQEYSKTLDAIQSIRIVKERHRLIAERKKQEEERKEKQQELQQQAQKVEEVAKVQEELKVPTETEIIIPEVEEVVLCTQFKVWGTKEQLIKLRDFLENGGYKYEQ